jgi:cysteine synthase
MNYVNDIKDLIGGTPMLKLNHLGIHESVGLFAKLELFNPGGSVKDRIGVSMIEDAEARGLLKPGSTIVEATAGNAGIGIALAALNRGYRVIFTVPEKFSIEKQVIMRAYGAEIVHTPKADGMQGAIGKAQELLVDIPNSITLSQFTNKANPTIHYETTGPEIYEQMDGRIDYLVAGAGSGGTVTGVLRYLKQKNPKIRGVLADPIGSTMGGGEEGCYAIEGIGNTFMPETMDMGLIDDVVKVKDEEALASVKLLAAKEGILAGTSSGAALSASLTLAKRIKSGTIVTIFPDRGDRYFSKNIL